MSTFSRYTAVAKLKELAKAPIDLTKTNTLTPERIKTYSASNGDFSLIYSQERVTDETLAALEALAQEAKVFDKMAAMQNGEVLNRIEGCESENRSVMHTAMRDFFEAPSTGKVAVETTKKARAEVEKLRRFIDKLDKEQKFTDLIQVGIGGSDLGPRALYLAMLPYRYLNRRVHFISNVDPDDAAAVLAQVDPAKTLVVVVSKSGSTLETLTNEELCKAHFRKAGCDPKEHFIAVTGEGSPLDDPSKYLASFYMWDSIGGRYSATSMVGGVMLAFGLGFNTFYEILRGASAMDKHALNTTAIRQNLPLMAALLGIWNRNFLGHHTVAVIPYSQALLRFPAHLQQLDMESDGKRIDKSAQAVDFTTGPILWGEPGTNAQHSFFQSIHQGTTVVPVEFIGFKESQYGQDLNVKGTLSQQKLLANLFAQSLALATGKQSDNPNKFFPGNRPTSILLGKKLDPYHLGALLAYYEHKVAFQGFIWNINSFDQEGVQLGKLLATNILNLISTPKEHPYPLAQALLDHVNALQ